MLWPSLLLLLPPTLTKTQTVFYFQGDVSLMIHFCKLKLEREYIVNNHQFNVIKNIVLMSLV